MSQQSDRPKYAFVSEPEYPEGGKVKQRIKLSFKPEQLEAMKEFVTEKGKKKTYNSRPVHNEATDDLPF